MSARDLPTFDPVGDLDARLMGLEASAGTGKTYSITTLFLRLVAEPPPAASGLDLVEPQQILVVTFTEAATAQMREKIRSRLRAALDHLDRVAARPGWDPEDGSAQSREWREKHDSDGVMRLLIRNARAAGQLDAYARRVRAALEGFDEITISTIHGFCQRMLLRNAFESGAAFDCELLAETGPLLEEIVLDWWTRTTWELPPDLLRVLRGKAGLGHLKKVAAMTAQDPELKILPETPPFDARTQDGWRCLLKTAQDEWAQQGDALREVLGKACKQKWLDGRSYSEDKVGVAAGKVTDWLAAAVSEGADLAPKSGTDPLQPIKLLGREFIQEKGEAKGKPALKLPEVSSTFQKIFDGRDAQLASERAFLMNTRRSLLDEVRRVLPLRKSELHVQGFDDLLRNLRDAVAKEGVGDALREAIGRQYRVAIIDEFQDTDPVQWDIFRRVFGDDPRARLFLVGDPKQAIYSFRRADVETYLEACRTVTDRGGRRSGLKTNWRSDGRLVRAMNHLYGPRLGDGFAREGIGYQEVGWPPKHGEASWSNPRGVPRWEAPLRLALLRREPAQADPRSKEAATRQAVDFTASDILDFLGSGLRVARAAGMTDDVRPGDVAVIVRTHGQGQAIARALRRRGVPVVRRGQERVFQSAEAKELRWVMDGLLTPRDRGAARTALATDLVGMDATALARLETCDEAVEEWRVRLERWARTWEEQGFMRMFRAVLAERDAMPRLLALPDGERRVTNLLHLAELLHEAGKSSALRPDALRAWLARMIDGTDVGPDAEAALIRLESDADAVKIVTAHGCKGLEYPFVWVPFLGLGRDAGGGLLRLHVEAEGAPGQLRAAVHIAPEDPKRSEAKPIADREDLGEVLRLAYVALTRARHACTVVTQSALGLEVSAAGWLLHQEGDLAADATVAERLVHLKKLAGRTDDDLMAQLDAIAQGSDGSVLALDEPGVVRLRTGRWSGVDDAPDELERDAPLSRHLDRSWRRASFSGMRRGAREEHVTAEVEEEPTKIHDEGVEDEAAAHAAPPRRRTELVSLNLPGPIAPGDVALDEYPRGRKAGDFMHKVLEVLDFEGAVPERIAQVVEETAPTFGMTEPWTDRRTQRRIHLADAIRKVLTTPLGLPGKPEHALTLASVARRDTLREVDFDLAVGGGFDARHLAAGGGVSHRQVAEAFVPGSDSGGVADAYKPAADRLTFDRFRGYLTGSIDLAFRWSPKPQSGRQTWKWYVVDYKSNRLAPEPRRPSRWADYQPDELRDEMVHAHYVLQYHLYVTALHRYLKQRLEGYRYERHFGGVYYLFLRGMQGGDGQGDTGVFRDRPPEERIERLSRLFEEVKT